MHVRCYWFVRYDWCQWRLVNLPGRIGRLDSDYPITFEKEKIDKKAAERVDY